jgi:hypothetical protein
MPFAKRNAAAAIYRTAAHRKARAALIAAFRPGGAKRGRARQNTRTTQLRW